jgi:hypothetical protein
MMEVPVTSEAASDAPSRGLQMMVDRDALEETKGHSPENWVVWKRILLFMSGGEMTVGRADYF